MSEAHSPKPAPWWEIVLLITLYIACSWFAKELAPIFILIFALYMLVEARLRHRTWVDNGFRPRDILAGLRQTLGWVLLVACGSPVLFVFVNYLFFPEVFTHLVARVPIDISQINVGLLITLGVLAFLEEFTFRALFQGRLSAFCPPAIAICITSLIFALVHYAPGPALIVGIDLLSVFVDSVIYGIAFQRSQNVFVSWIAHWAGNSVAIVLLSLIR